MSQKRARNKMPSRKPTKIEHQKRVRMCVELLSRGFRDGEIKREVSNRYDCSPRTVERYLRRARDELADELGASRAEHKARSLDQYRAILRNPGGTPPALLIKAQERIDKLLGLESPHKVHQEIEGKVSVLDALTSPEIVRIRRGRGSMEESSSNGNGTL